MALKQDHRVEEVSVVKRWSGGLTWMAHPSEGMQRASQALLFDDDVWLVDPLDGPGLDEVLADLGTVTGVVVLTNSHGRSADQLASHYDVSIHVPACFEDPDAQFDVPVVPFEDKLAETGFELVWEKGGSGWQEGALYHPERRTLVVADALMTSLFTGRHGRLELFPLFRLSPPREALGDLAVDRVLVSHGEPVFEDAQRSLDDALAGAHRRTPLAIARAVPTFVRIAYHEVRG